jgi:hypothetical protein
MNGLYKKTKYIGLCQYDMRILHNTIPDILSEMDDKTIYVHHFFPWWFLGGQKVIVQDLHIFECGLNCAEDLYGYFDNGLLLGDNGNIITQDNNIILY